MRHVFDILCLQIPLSRNRIHDIVSFEFFAGTEADVGFGDGLKVWE